MSSLCTFQQVNNNFQMELDICENIENDHENLDCYFSIWEKLKNLEFGEMHISIASEISASLALLGQYDLMNKFLSELEKENIQKLVKNERFLRAYIALKFDQRDYKEAYSLLKNGNFRNANGLLEVWDEAHYRERETEIGKPLTPLMRFRIRKRNPPPTNICPSGERPSTKLKEESRNTLQEWFEVNKDNPYPSPETRESLAKKTGLSAYQVKTWFANARRRLKMGMQKQVKPRNLKRHILDESRDDKMKYIESSVNRADSNRMVTNGIKTTEKSGNDVCNGSGSSLHALANLCSWIGFEEQKTNLPSQNLNLNSQPEQTYRNHIPFPESHTLYPLPRQSYPADDRYWLDYHSPIIVPTTNNRFTGCSTSWSNCGWTIQQCADQSLPPYAPAHTQRIYFSNTTSPIITSNINHLQRPRSCPPAMVQEASSVMPCWHSELHSEYYVEFTKPVTVFTPVPVCRMPKDYHTVELQSPVHHNFCTKSPVSEQEAVQGLLYLSEDKSANSSCGKFV